MPWAVRAPTLLLIAVIGSAAPFGGPPQPPPSSSSPPPPPQPLLQLSYQVLRSELQRRPTADLLLDSPGAVTDLCTAVELVLERLTVRGDWQSFVTLLAALLAALGGAISELCSRITEAAEGRPPPQAQPGDARLAAPAAVAVAVAALQEAAAAALAALHASCRQIGSACARVAAAADAGVSPLASAAAAAAAGAPAAARTTTGQGQGPGQRANVRSTGRPKASEALASVAEHVCAAAAAAAAAAAGAPERAAVGVVATASDPLDGGRGRGDGVPPTLAVADPWVTLSVAAAAAGGLLEGCALTLRLQPPGRPQELLLRLLQPATGALSRALQEAAASAAAAGATPTAVGSTPDGGRTSACAVDADPRVMVLSMAVGYGWSRLRAQAPLSGPLQPARLAADAMVASASGAATGAAAASDSSGVGCWHPSRGALAALLLGSLGVGRALRLVVEAAGGSADAAAELLEDHTRGPLFADTQLLAKAVVEALRTPAPAPTASAALASALLLDAAAAAKRLNLLYGGVADAAAGRAQLAALPKAATGALRELLDRAFVCEVSVLAAAYDSLSAATSPAAPPEPGLPTSASRITPSGVAGAQGRGTSGAVNGAAEVRAPAAAMALGALADLQFCALQLRAHGDLVARLSADVIAAPAAALPPLLARLPCYPAFAASYGGGFAAAPVAASRLAFLLPLACSCVPHATDVGAAASAVLPYTYLLLKGAPESVVQAAHSTWAALLAGLCERAAEARDAGAAAGAAAGGGGGGGRSEGSSLAGGRNGREVRGGAGAGCPDDVAACVAVAASMVPYYIERTCQEPCTVGDLELMEWGLRQVLKSLPEAHPMKVWSTARLVRQLTDWAALAEPSAAGEAVARATSSLGPVAGAQGRGGAERVREAGGQEPQGGGASPADVRAPGVAALVQRCSAAVGMCVMLLDYSLLPAALESLDSEMRGLRAHPNCATLLLQQLHNAWLSCNDYARKPLLEHWQQRSLIQSRIQARL